MSPVTSQQRPSLARKVTTQSNSSNGESAVYKRKINTSTGKDSQDLEELLTDTVLKLEEIDTDLYRYLSDALLVLEISPYWKYEVGVKGQR